MAISAGFYLCAVMSKSAAILLPSAVVLLDFVVGMKIQCWRKWIASKDAIVRRTGCYVLSKSPFWLIFCAFLWLTIHFNENGDDLEVEALQLDRDERVLKALMTPMWVARHYMWPINVRMHYQVEEDFFTVQTPAVCMAVVVFGAIFLRAFPLHLSMCWMSMTSC